MSRGDAADRKTFYPARLRTGPIVPEALLTYRKVSPGARLAYAVLRRLAWRDGCYYGSAATLGRALGVSEKQARRYLHQLARHKLLQAEERTGDTTRYRFLIHSLFRAELSKGVDTSGRGGGTYVSRGVDTYGTQVTETVQSVLNKKTRKRSEVGSAPADGQRAVSGICPDCGEADGHGMVQRGQVLMPCPHTSPPAPRRPPTAYRDGARRR